MTRREVLALRDRAQTPLVQSLAERGGTVARDSLEAIDALVAEVFRLQSVVNSRKSTAARSGKEV